MAKRRTKGAERWLKPRRARKQGTRPGLGRGRAAGAERDATTERGTGDGGDDAGAQLLTQAAEAGDGEEGGVKGVEGQGGGVAGEVGEAG
eukprot:CAMPEP_0182832312 /NCGR_PEP_ID=MMETSP0006_2-20121128/19648_1 /TAXON_ID=97485 /ORGANISM="Prymnesium parvum, Strain Texoma1" /LENGTH=89 /DNA_ID=CAMNT_0024960151 /DNA_START=20 /DNA_END=285 /DNA_ORIENTATION=+